MSLFYKIRVFLLLSSISLFFSNCSNRYVTNTGAYSDISLNRNSSEYEIKRLKEVEATGNAFWGIPYIKNSQARNKTGFIFRFNGVNVFKVRKIFPILTLIGTSITAGTYLQTFAGYHTIKIGNTSYPDPLNPIIPWYWGSIISLPITGIINNLTWRNVALSNSIHELNYKLINENPDIDVFSNPKYVVDNKLRIWSQEANVKVNTLGSRIKTERIIIQKP